MTDPTVTDSVIEVVSVPVGMITAATIATDRRIVTVAERTSTVAVVGIATRIGMTANGITVVAGAAEGMKGAEVEVATVKDEAAPARVTGAVSGRKIEVITQKTEIDPSGTCLLRLNKSCKF